MGTLLIRRTAEEKKTVLKNQVLLRLRMAALGIDRVAMEQILTELGATTQETAEVLTELLSRSQIEERP